MNDSPLLAPLPYHREIRDYLKTHERELWNWHASARAQENYAEELRLHLLKSTYRLTRESHADLYALADAAARGLGLSIPVTLYQAQRAVLETSGANAALYYHPQEAHIVLSGPISTLLTPPELTAVFAHELAHYHLWQIENEEFLIADRVLHAAAQHPSADAAHHETARQYRLHTEIYADRGSAHAVQQLPTVVAALVKTNTGLPSVNGESYLAQAAEIFAQGKAKSEELTHPELFIRAYALELWTRQGEAANTTVRELIAGDADLGSLDLLAQAQHAALTRRFLAQLLQPKWFRTDATLAQAKLYFPDFTPSDTPDPTLLDDLRATGALLKDYFAYVLLDAVAVDRELDETPLAVALRWAENLGISAPFEKLVTKELGIKARDLAKLKPRINDLLALAEQGRG